MDNQESLPVEVNKALQAWTNDLLPVYLATRGIDDQWNYDTRETEFGVGIHLQNNYHGAAAMAYPSDTSVWSIHIWLTQKEEDIHSAPLVLAVAELDSPYQRAKIGEGIAINEPSQRQAGETVLNAIKNAMWKAREKDNRTEIYASIPGLSIDTMGGMVPYEAFGKWNNYDFYFRYRHGLAELRLGHHDATHDLVFTGVLWSAWEERGDEYDGCLNNSEFVALFCSLFARLEPAPFRYEFEGLDGKDSKAVWADSARQAQELLRDSTRGNIGYQREPKNLDDRVYPVVAPDFLVLPSVDQG